MFGRIAALVGQVAESALSIVGIRSGTEEPRHNSEPLGDGVVLREYGPRIAAETTVTAVEADEEGARSEGFRRLAAYIFGKNTAADDIAMTAPVVQAKAVQAKAVQAKAVQAKAGRKIAMTAPVAQSAQDVEVGTGWVIRFFMPSKWTLATLPTPVDERVRLVEVPGETFAVLRFSGDRSAAVVATRTAELLDVMHAYGFEAAGEPAAWFYDPPWTLPFRRRNEIAVPVAV